MLECSRRIDRAKSGSILTKVEFERGLSCGTFRSVLAGCCSALLLLGSVSSSLQAHAATMMDEGTDLEAQLSNLPTGDQLAVSDRTGSVRFAGHDVQLDDFSGLFGFGSEVAYVLVLDGQAKAGGKVAGQGRMLLAAPFTGEVAVERFDANRLHDALAAEGTSGPIMSRLGYIAESQRIARFFGRLAPTTFNVTTAGSASQELERRQRIGGTEIRNTRFAAASPGEDIERGIVRNFMAALAAGDAEGVSQYLDPLPYGYNNLDDGGGEARKLIAQSLIDERDWTVFAGAEPAKTGETQWTVRAGPANALITLRRTTEFAFVQSIETGN
jgi:hypothetical protein